MPPSLISLPRPLITRLLSSRWTITRTGTSSLWRVQRRATGKMTFSPSPTTGLDIKKDLAHMVRREEKKLKLRRSMRHFSTADQRLRSPSRVSMSWAWNSLSGEVLPGRQLLNQLGRTDVPVVGQNIGFAQNHFRAVIQVQVKVL